MFRLCDDEGLVSAVTTPDKPPSLADLEALEQCFQRGLLRCDDVDGNDCSQVEVCGEYAADWGACADPGKFLHCRDEKKTEGKYWACVNTAETCDHGKMARYKLRIPESFPASQHTILSYRWDTYENNEVFVGCADIAITTDGGDAPPAPMTPRPTKAPTKDEIDWDCSGYSESCHRIDHNNGDAFKALGPTTSWGSEAVCANKDKQARWSTHWCPKQDLTCTKANSCRRLDACKRDAFPLLFSSPRFPLSCKTVYTYIIAYSACPAPSSAGPCRAAAALPIGSCAAPRRRSSSP